MGPWEVGTVAEPRVMTEFTKVGSTDGVPGLIAGIVVAVKRLLMLTLVMVGSEIVDGRAVSDDGRLVTVIDGSKVDVKLLITDTADGMVVIGNVVPETDSRGSEVTGFVSMIGLPSGPTLTARLASMTTVLVPLRRDPIGGSPKFCVNVHKPSAKLKPVHVEVLEQVWEQSK